MKKNVYVIVLFFMAQFGFAKSSFKFEPSKGKVEFATKGWPSLIIIKGTGAGVGGELLEQDGKLSGTLDFNLSTLKTGISLRDTHMKDNYLEVKKYPQARLTIKDLVLPKDVKGEITFKGDFLIHGTTKAVEGTAKVTPNGKEIYRIDAEVPIKLSDFKIEIPSYKGITVAEKVKIQFTSNNIFRESAKSSQSKSSKSSESSNRTKEKL